MTGDLKKRRFQEWKVTVSTTKVKMRARGREEEEKR